jgi:curli biogenesis system outer membrane secretion channel CsgG
MRQGCVMRKIVMVGIAAGAFFVLQAQPDKRRIAIYDFDYSSVKSEVVKSLGADSNVGHNVAEMLLSPLTESGAYEVMDRARVESIMKEQNLKFSSRFDSSQAVAYGKILQVDAIVTGTVNNLSVERVQKTKGLLGVGHKVVDLKATVEITAQMISTETGQIYLAPSSIQEATEEIGRENGFTDPGAAGSQTGSSVSGNVDAQVVRKAIHLALDDISKDMIRKASGLPKRIAVTKGPSPGRGSEMASLASSHGTSSTLPPSAPRKPISGMVMDITDGSIFIDKGATAGVRQGDSFEVRHYLKTVTNAAGKQIKLDQKIGDLTIVEVSDDWARGTFAGQTQPQKNDVVKLK